MICGGAARLPAFCPSVFSIAFVGSLRHPKNFAYPFSTKMALGPSSAGSNPQWLDDLQGSLAKNKEVFDKYVQLGTVTADGKPAVRTVVFRGFVNPSIADEGSVPEAKETLTFITDRRSSKMNDGLDAEVCWYLSGTREQFRLRGKLQMIMEGSVPGLERLRFTMWKQLSDAARKQFLWPDPGVPRPLCDEEQDRKDFDDVKPSATEPPNTFVLVLLRPDRVDHLQLKGFPQRRTVSELGADGKWDKKSVNP